MIINPQLTPIQFLRTVAKRFDIEVPYNYKDNLLDAIYEKVYHDYETGITPVIIIDEAQLIPNKKTFEEIRLLTNFQLDHTNLLSLILVGQTDLRKKAETQDLSPAAAADRTLFIISALWLKSEIKGYIEHRLKISGLENPLFTDKALRQLYRYSGGNTEGDQ